MIDLRYDKLTAEKYEEFASKFDLYHRTGRFLMKMADIRPGMFVLDLGCGTGIVTVEILKEMNGVGKVVGIDYSRVMLSKARKKFLNKPVSLIHGKAEDVASLVSDEPDVTLCNAAFWQMDTNKVLEGLNKVMKKGGCFVFNLSRGKFNFTRGRYNFKYDADKYNELGDVFQLMHKIAMKKHHLSFRKREVKSTNPNPCMDDIKALLNQHSFSLERYELLEFERTSEDMHCFLQIPEWTNRIFPTLSYPQVMDLVDEAFKQLDTSRKFLSRWICFRTLKT